MVETQSCRVLTPIVHRWAIWWAPAAQVNFAACGWLRCLAQNIHTAISQQTWPQLQLAVSPGLRVGVKGLG